MRSDLHAPDGCKDCAVAERNRGHARPAVGSERLHDGRVRPIQVLVAFFLPSVGGNGLVQVALGIHETHANQRHAEVGGLLAVIAGKDAEPSGVDRQRLVEREFGREVRDGPLEVGKGLRPPGMPRRARFFEAVNRALIQVHEGRIRRCGLELLAGNLPQHANRVVRRRPPQRVVELAKDHAAFAIPAPPKVDCEFWKTAQGRRKRRKTRIAIHAVSDRIISA